MAVFPAALIGFAGLTDGVGPTGWRGLSEVFGWFIACLATAVLLTLILARGSRMGTPAYVLALAIVAATGVVAYELLDWIGLDAPMSAKALFTSSMQALGALATAVAVLLIAHAVWKRAWR